MARVHNRRLDPIVLDKHLDGEELAPILGRRPLSAALQKPTRPYRGQYSDDEDFADVLQLGWQNEATVLTCDGGMIAKGQRFERQLPKAESCLRGIIVLPRDKAAQIDVLRRFVAGEIVPIAERKGEAAPKTLFEIEDFNIAIDLRQGQPRAVRLCDCE